MRTALKANDYRFIPTEYLNNEEESPAFSPHCVRGARSYFDISHKVVVLQTPVSHHAPRFWNLFGGLLARLGFWH